MPLREYTDKWIALFREDSDAARHRDAGGDAARDRRGQPAGHGRADRRPRAQRAHLSARRVDLLQDRHASAVRPAGAARSRRDEGRRERRRGRILQGRCARLRVVEGGEAGRAVVGLRHRPWPARLAPRVLGDGAAAARRAADRHPRRRHRPDLSASRERDRAERGRHGTSRSSRFWFHVEHLFVENEKMSKSLGNVYTLAEIVARGHRPSALRYLLLSSHYRKQLNFTWTGMDQAEEAIRRIVDFLARLDTVTGDGGESPHRRHRSDTAREAFRAALQHDLNTAAALAAVFDLVRDVNAAIDARAISATEAAAVRQAMDDFDKVLGVVEPAPGGGRAAARAGGGDRAADRGAEGRAPAARFRGRRSHPGRPGGSRHPARGQPGRDALEEEIERERQP